MKAGGDGGIRTLDTLNTYDDLANRCLQPLGHVSTGRGFCRDLIDHASASELLFHCFAELIEANIRLY